MTSSIGSRAARGILGQYVERAAALPPATGVSADLFSVDGGAVLITGFYGLATVAMPNAVLSFDLAHDPDSGGSDVALASALSVQSAAVGTFWRLNATLGSALVATLDAGIGVALANPIQVTKGDLKLNVTGGGAIGTTARAKWGLWYVPIEAGATITAV